MRQRITAIIFLILLGGITIYVWKGKNWFAEQHYLQRTKNEAFIRNELKEKFLQLQDQSQELLQDFMDQAYGISLLPDQQLELTAGWSVDIRETPIFPPIFDYKYIYIATPSQLSAISKKNGELQWNFRLESTPARIELLDANRLLVLSTAGELHCLHRNTGSLLWLKELTCEPDIEFKKNNLFQISLNRYQRLDSSIILVLSKNEIYLLNIFDGELAGKYESDDEIDFISEFDDIERCIYLTHKGRLSKLNFRIKA
ncbi:MAG: PQQ-binding-like beta-propeller repeat protein [Candidatus Cloacimonetes bacterium]|nr:PQQ-binding-like beta-propeller repeat protein [Candidatus Cloacimonadota bacterium]